MQGQCQPYVSVINVQSTQLLGTKTPERLCRPDTGLNPLRIVLNDHSGFAVDTGIVKRMVRMAVTLGYSSLLVQHSVCCRVVGLSSG